MESEELNKIVEWKEASKVDLRLTFFCIRPQGNIWSELFVQEIQSRISVLSYLSAVMKMNYQDNYNFTEFNQSALKYKMVFV